MILFRLVKLLVLLSVLISVSLQYPMYSRDYVYVRRYQVDFDSNLMILVSRWDFKK